VAVNIHCNLNAGMAHLLFHVDRTLAVAE